MKNPYMAKYFKSAKGRAALERARIKYLKTAGGRAAVRRVQENYLNTHPWAKTHRWIRQRCSKGYLWGVKNFLTTADLKFLWDRDSAHLMAHPSIDRIDGTKHYTLDNCRYVEMSVNRKNKP